MSRAADQQVAPRPRRGTGALVLLGLLLVAVASVLALAPASPRGADAPPTAFSAARATTELEQVARAPRPVGSPEHARVREHLLAVLAAQGWAVEVHEAVGTADPGGPGTQAVALVRNLVATLPGTAPTGAVVLAAHYDTVAGSPGAADDGIGIATLLEVARALRAGGTPPRNDVVLLVTDAEEPGLLGAEAFARERAGALAPAVVLNHEARGAWGAPTTFRTTSPNGALLDALARAPGAFADSASEAAFEALPNGTDVTRFEAAGLHAYDTAISAGGAHYHSPVDDLEHLSPASLQQMGDTTLALTRDLAGQDLAALADGGEQVVTSLPWGLLRYPAAAEVPLGLAPLALVAASLVLRRRRGALTLPATALGAVVAVAALTAAGVAGWAVWRAALAVDPGQASAVVGEPYRPLAHQVAVVAAALGAAALLPAAVRRRTGPDALALGALAVLAVVGALLALTVPGVSGVLVLPVLCAAAGALAADLLPRRAAAARGVVAVLAAAAVTVLLAPTSWVGFDVGLTLGGPVSAVVAGLLVLLVLPALPAPTAGRRGATVPVLLLVGAVAAGGAGLVLNREGSTAPRQEQVLYALDAGTGEAAWTSFHAPRTPWARSLLTEPPAALDALLPRADGAPLHHGPAPAADLPPPTVEVVSDRPRAGGRELVLRLASARGAPALGLWVDAASASVREVGVAGRELPVHGPRGPWASGVVVEGAPPEGVEVRLLLDQRGDDVALRVADRSDDLDDVPVPTPPRGRVLALPQTWVSLAVTL